MGGEGPANYDYFDLNRENLTKMVKMAETSAGAHTFKLELAIYNFAHGLLDTPLVGEEL